MTKRERAGENESMTRADDNLGDRLAADNPRGHSAVSGERYPFGGQVDAGGQSGGAAEAAERALQVGLLQQLPLVRRQTCRTQVRSPRGRYRPG